jgi:ATP-dependent Clp protease protease subunit
LANIYLFGIIENSDWDDAVSAKNLAKQLDGISDSEDVTVYINSPGGDVFEGHAIYNLLAELKDRLTIKIIGQASSIASEIACAAGKGRTLIADNAMMFLHYPWKFGIISEGYLEKLKFELNAVKESIYSSYTKKSGLNRKKLDDILSQETYHNAKECVAYGFADKVWNPSEEETTIIWQSQNINERIMKQFAQRTFQNLTRLNNPDKLSELNIYIDTKLFDLIREGADMPEKKKEVQEDLKPVIPETPVAANDQEIKAEKLEARITDLSNQITMLRNQLDKAEAERDEVKALNIELETKNKSYENKFIELDVDKTLENLKASKRILPKEYTDYGIVLNIGGQRITRDQLLNLKRNEETIRISEDISVYDHLIEQVRNREEMGGLNAVLPEANEEDVKIKKNSNELKDMNAFRCRILALGKEWDMDAEVIRFISNYAKENEMSLDDASQELINLVEEGE